MGDENQIPQAPKPDWIASAISGQLKTPSQLMAAGVKASDFNFDENLDTYWKTPVVQEHFKNDKNSFIDFYSKQKEVYNQTKKSDYELDFNIDVATDKWSRKPLIGFSTKTQVEDPFGRNNFGDYYSPKKFSEREQAIKTGVKIGDEYIPVAQYKGDIKLAKDEFGNYKRDSHNRTYWEPIKADEEFRSFDESYDSFAHNMGIYGLNPSYLSEGFYTVVKSVPNFINSTSSSLLEFPRVFGADVSGIQNQLKQNLLPSSDRTKENFFSPVHLAELGLDSVMQLFSMGAVGKVAGALSGSAKTASAAGRIYMTGMAAGPMAQISRENNLSPVETAILYGANAAAIYKLSGLSDMIVRGIRPLELEKIIAPKLAQDYGVTIAKKGFTESALKSFQNRVGRTFESALISLSSKPYVKTSFLEGIEEMGEQTVDTGIRGLHNVMAELLPLQGRFQWDLGREVEAILQSGAGGAFGGAIAHPILKKLSNYDRELVDSFEAAVAFNDEGFVHKMINDWEKAGRLSKDGKTGEENTRNATALREILNTMSTIRDRAGITDAIKNNEKKAGIFADILKSSSIGRDKIILQNELATLTNQLENAEKADDKQLIENLTKQVEAKKAEISEFNSGSQVSRYITEGLYNVESNPHLKSTVIDSSDLGIEGLTEFGLRNNDHFNGKLFTLMNTDSRNNRDRLKSEVSKRNQELIENSAKANLDNFNELDITPDAKQRLLDEANARRNQEVENYKNSGVDNIINEIFADDEDFDASLVHTSNPEFSFRFSQEVLKRAVEPYKNEEWYAKVAPLFAAEELVNKVSQKKTYKTAPDIEGDSHLYYDFENGKSTVPLESKLEELARAAGQLTGTPKEESDRLSKMFVSPEPDRIIQVIDDRISQVLGNYALKNKKGYNEIISAEVYDTKNALLTLAALKGQFAQLKALSDENEKNTDARILQVYIKSLEKQFNVLQNFVKLLETDIPKIGEIFSEHEVEMQEALDKQDYISYRRESLQVDKKMFDFVRSQRTEVLQKLQKTFKGGDPELLSDEGILAKNTYDYARAVLSNDPTKFVQAAREVIAELKPDVKTPTREHQLVAELALRNAMAGNYDFRVKNSSRELFHLSYTSAVNGGPGTGKTVTEIPFIAAMINKMTGGNVIVTAYKDPSGKKIQKVRSDVEKFFKGKPDFIQHSDSSLIDILKSNEVKNVSAIIFDEAALLSASELNKINTELLRVNQSRPNNPVHLIYTYDEAQNGFREKNSKTTYSITSPVISVPSTPRLTFSFRSVNNPLKALENALRNSQFSNALPSNIALNYDKDFNGVRFVSNKEELEKLVVDLATKLKSEKNLSSMVYINANPENTAVSSASALSLNVLDSVQSQGDEWDYVVVDTSDGEIFGSSIRQKEVYTAVTRAKKGVIVYASPSMPVSSVEGVVKEFKPMTPPEISQQTMLNEIDSILQGQTIDSSFNPAETIKTPSQAVPPVVQTPTTTETPAPSPVSQDDLEMADYRRIMNAMTNTENRVLLNTFYDVQGELEIKKSILFNPSVRDNSNYQVTIAKIGSPGYVPDARIDFSKFNGKYAIFLEAVTPDNKRAVLGVIYRAGGEKVETTLRNLNIITQGETRDVVATYPVSNNILRAGQFFHPFIENESSSENVSPDGNKQSEAVDKKTYSNILSEAKSKGITVSPILIATADIINSKGKVSVRKGEPFVALSYKHSARQMYNNEFDVLGDDIKTMTLNRESFSLDQIVELLSPFYSRNQKGYYEATSAEFKNLYNSFWQSSLSKGERLYEKIFNNVKEELSKKDPQVDMFLKKMDVERKAHEVTLTNGKKIRVKGGYQVEYLLDDYVKISLEKDAKKLLNMNSEPKRKLLMAMMENKTFSRGLRFSPFLSKGSSGFEQNLYAQSVPYQENFLNRVISANYFKLDLPKIQIPIEAVLSEISTQNKEAAPAQPVGKTVQQTVQQSVQESVQGPAISVNPISIVEFRRREFPNQPNLARKAIDKFKKDVVASHLVLTVPEGGTPRILDANEAMTNLKKIYLSNGNLMSQKTNTESRIQYALGSNFNGLLAQYFPSIKYNSSKDEYYYGNDLSKSGSFAEKEMENLLGDGMNSIVKTYLYNTRLANGNYITSKNISNVLKLIKNNTNSDGQAIRTLDEIAEVLSNSSLPEAKAIYKRFFSKFPESSSVTGSQTNNLTYSTRGVETPAGQNLTNAILSFLTKGQVYSPGFVDVNVYYDENTSSEQRTAKLPIGGFNPQYIKTQFLDKFARILSTGRISVSNGDVNLNGQLYTVEKNVTPENALRMLKGMGFEGFTSEMLQDAVAVDPTILGQIQDYFFASVKNYNKKQGSLPSLGLVMDKIIEQFVSAKGLGNDFSFKDGTGKRQYGLRDSAPIFHLKHVVSSAQKSPLLQTNLLVDENSSYGISSKPPFTHLGFKINKNGFEFTKSVSQLTVPELLDLYLIEGYVTQIENGRNEATFPITVYADASQEISPIFYSNNFLQPAEKTLGDLFDSRTKYYAGLEFKILNDYREAGISAKSIGELNSILSKLTEDQINTLISYPNMVSGVHYNEKSVKGPLSIKQELIDDINMYMNPANKQAFIDRILADAQKVVEYSKNQRGGGATLYNQIAKTSSKATPEEFIKTFYANWLLFSGEFQHLMNGPKYQYKESGQKAFIDMVKRSKSLISPESYFILRNKNWAADVALFRQQNPGKPLPYSLMYEGKKLSRVANVMRFEDPINNVLKFSNGQIVSQKWMDGATLVTPFTRIKQNYSSALDAGPFVGPVMKNITHSNDFESGTKSFVKNAEFEITPYILENGNEFVIEKFVQMTSAMTFPEVIQVNGESVSNAYQLIIALGMNPNFSNATKQEGIFEKAMDIMVENGFQDYIVDEAIFQSSEKTGQRGVNKLSDPNPKVSTIDITMKGIQQDGAKDPSQGMEVNVLTQLVNAIAINWVNSPVLKKFYDTLSDMTKSYIQELSKMKVAERVKYFSEIMREDLLSTDGSNYRTDAASVNRLSINDRTIAPKYTQTIATNIRNSAVAFGLQGGHFVIHPSLMDVYEVEEISTESPVKRILLKSQVRNLDTQKYKITSRRLKWQSPVREDGVSLTEMYETGIDQETINNSLRNDKWSKGFAEILLPAEMFEDFELDDVIANNIPIDEINERYFLQKLLTPDEFNSKIISDNKKKRAKLMYESFRTRLEGVMARIPTSGKHSGVSTVIAGFFQGSMNSVMVPAELFTVQGADQDYDKGSYVTYQSIKEYTMVDPTVKGGREIKTYDPRNPNYSQFVVKNVRPTGLIPFESNLNEIKSVKNFSKEDLKAIQKIAQKNELARAMNDVLSDSKSLIELNTTLEDVMTELRALKEVILEGSSEEQKLKFDHLMSLLQIHEMNQAGGKNLVGIFANGAKAYNVIYLAKRLKEIKEGKDFSGEPDKIWENFASLISAAVDNANEGVLGPLSFDQITAPYISYLVSTGMSTSQIAEYINAKKPFFDAIRKSKEYNSTKGFNINSQPLEMQKLYLYKTEWDVLTQSLINRDIPITMEDIASHILTLENYVNMSYSKAGLQTEPFNFERFFSDDRSYAERQIKLYDSLIATGNHNSNILEIFDNAPHMRAYQEAIAQAHNMFKDIKAYNTIYAVTSENLRNEALLSEPKKGVSINYRYNPENFTRDYNTVHGMYIHAYLNSRDTSLITTANLGSYEGRIQFINEVNNSLLNLKSKYPDNEFIKDLTLDTNDFTKESKIRMYDFYDMNDDLRALYMEEFQRLEPIDRKRLFIYNLIVTRDRNSKGSFTSLMSIDDKSDYINFLDYEVNIPNKSLADAINQEIANEDGRAKLNNLAIPYSDFKFEKNPAKLVGKKTYISKDFKEPINVEYVTYINKLSISPYAVAVIMVNNNPVVRVDKKVLEVNFRMKRWTSPVKLADGTYSTALPYNAFETLEQYENFNIEYEYLAFKNSQMPVNDRIQRALMNVGKNKFVPYTTNKETENNMAKCSIKVYDEVSGSYVNPR